MGSEIRLGQLIAPFGPGSIYTDKYGIPTLICGLDHWYKNYNENGRLELSSKAVQESALYEPRLSQLLKVDQFRQPPAFIRDENNPEISKLKIQGHRFPRWYVNNASGYLRQLNLETMKLPTDGIWKPVRFISVCSKGHMSDFPWKQWSRCSCANESGLYLNDSGGVDLSSIRVGCKNCGNSNNLAGATLLDREVNETGLSRAGISCLGEKPWLGSGHGEACQSPLSGVLINQSNIYFPKTLSSIFLPDINGDPDLKEIQTIFLENERKLSFARVADKMGFKDQCIKILHDLICENIDEAPSDEVIYKAFESFNEPELAENYLKPLHPDSELLSYRRAEYNILRNEVPLGVSSELLIIPADVPNSVNSLFSRVCLVERMRETKVFYGFDRLERSSAPIQDMPDSAMRQLFLKPPGDGERWLPAVKNYGEGIYIELSENAIISWQEQNSKWLQSRYDHNFVNRMADEPMLLPPSADIDWRWASKYQLIHTLSHLLINQLIFECGYSTAALKERLFISSDPDAPMSGFLIYTSSGDSEGSMGGLVRLGRNNLLGNIVNKAISKASWCSSDPVCSEDLGGAGSRLVNKSACHACALLPETSCETINNGLDRAAVVGTPDNQTVGFMSDLLGEIFS